MKPSPKKQSSRFSPECHLRPPEKPIELEVVLAGHARQAAALADRLAEAEGILLDVIESNQTHHPMVALELLQRFERIRRSATQDCREAAMTLAGLRSKAAPIQVAIVQQQGEVNIRGQVAAAQRRKLQRG